MLSEKLCAWKGLIVWTIHLLPQSRTILDLLNCPCITPELILPSWSFPLPPSATQSYHYHTWSLVQRNTLSLAVLWPYTAPALLVYTKKPKDRLSSQRKDVEGRTQCQERHQGLFPCPSQSSKWSVHIAISLWVTADSSYQQRVTIHGDLRAQRWARSLI